MMSSPFRNKLILSFTLLLIAAKSMAAPIYEGYLYDLSSNPITTPVLVRLTIQDPAKFCSLYQEVHSVTPSPAGYFSVPMGAGTMVDKAGLTGRGPLVTMTSIDQAIENQGGYTCFAPVNSTYTPNKSDSRSVSIEFSADNGASYDSVGSIAMQAPSYAVSSGEAAAVGPFKPDNILRAIDANGVPATMGPFGPAQITSLTALSNRDGSGLILSAAQIPNLSPAQIPSLDAAKISTGTLAAAQGGTGQSTYADGDLLIGSTTGGLVKSKLTAGAGVTITNAPGSITISADGGGGGGGGGTGTVTSVTGTTPISVATGTTTPVISLASGAVSGQVFRWSGSGWLTSKLNYTDLVNSSSTSSPWPATSCVAGEAITWSSVSDSFACTALSIATSQLTGTIDAARMPAFTGDVTSTAGTTNLGLKNSGVIPGSYGGGVQVPIITVDPQGRITNATQSPINVSWNSVAPTAPTTLSGYGITDAIAKPSTLVTGGFLGYNGGNFALKTLNAADIKSSVSPSVSFFPTSCSASQALTYISTTDTLSCIDMGSPSLNTATTYFVRSTGNDSCNGLTDAGYTTGSTACALATVKAAIDKLPQKINAAATIQISDTITVANGLLIQKIFGGGGTLTIKALSGAVLNSAGDALRSPLFTIASTGFDGQSPSLVFDGLTINDSVANGTHPLFLNMMGLGKINNLTVNGAGEVISSHGGHIILGGNIAISLADGLTEASAIKVDSSGSVEFNGTGNLSITLGTSSTTGSMRQMAISVDSGSAFRFDGALLNINMNSAATAGTNGYKAYGIYNWGSGTIELKGTTTINANGGAGNLPIQISGGMLNAEGPVTINGSSGYEAISFTNGAIFNSRGNLTVNSLNSSSVSSALISLDGGAKVTVNADLTLVSVNQNLDSLIRLQGGSIFRFSPYNGGNFSVTAPSSFTKLFSASLGSSIEVGTASSAPNYSASGSMVKLADLRTGSLMALQGSYTTNNFLSLTNVSMDDSGRFMNNTIGPWGPASKVLTVPHGMVKFVYDVNNPTQTWTVPSGVSSLKATVIGGGAGAYYFNDTVNSITYWKGGGSGGSGYGYIPVKSGSSISIVIGAGGNSGNAGQPIGTNGGESRVTSTFSTNGGSPTESFIAASGGIAGSSSAWGTNGNLSNSPATLNTLETFLNIGRFGNGSFDAQQAQNGFVLIEF